MMMSDTLKYRLIKRAVTLFYETVRSPSKHFRMEISIFADFPLGHPIWTVSAIHRIHGIRR